MHRYQATIRTWAFSTNEGAAKDREAVGPEKTTIEVQGSDIKDAIREAELFRDGVRQNPRVWKCAVIGIMIK